LFFSGYFSPEAFAVAVVPVLLPLAQGPTLHNHLECLQVIISVKLGSAYIRAQQCGRISRTARASLEGAACRHGAGSSGSVICCSDAPPKGHSARHAKAHSAASGLLSSGQ
jgi:hypothetical protein